MIKRLKDLFFIAKEIKALLVFLGVSGVTFVEFKEFFLYYLHAYQIQWIILAVLMIYYITAVQKNLNKKIEDIYVQQQIRELKTKTLSAYKQYGNVVIDDELVASYVLALEAERAELKVNSFTQAQLAKMVSNIDYDKINYQG